jgi:hypothetical protein
MRYRYVPILIAGLQLIGPTVNATARTQYIALAIGKTDHLGAGLGWYKTRQEDAEDDALVGCQQSVSEGNCKIVLSGKDSCISLHWTPEGAQWGAAMRATRDEAESESLAQCGGLNKCVLVGSWCVE